MNIDTIVNKGVNSDKSLTKYGKKLVNNPSNIMDIISIIIGIILSPLTLLDNAYH